MASTAYIQCTVQRGPFSQERIVEVEAPGFHYRGAVPSRHCFVAAGCDAAIPLQGLMRVVVTTKTASAVALAMPDGELRELAADLAERILQCTCQIETSDGQFATGS